MEQAGVISNPIVFHIFKGQYGLPYKTAYNNAENLLKYLLKKVVKSY